MARETAIQKAFDVFIGHFGELLKEHRPNLPPSLYEALIKGLAGVIENLQNAVLRILKTPPDLADEEKWLAALNEAADQLDAVLEERGYHPYFQGRGLAVKKVASGETVSDVVNYYEARLSNLLIKGRRESFTPPPDFGEILADILDKFNTIAQQLAITTPSPPSPLPKNGGGIIGQTAKGAEKLEKRLQETTAEPPETSEESKKPTLEVTEEGGEEEPGDEPAAPNHQNQTEALCDKCGGWFWTKNGSKTNFQKCSAHRGLEKVE